VISGLGPEPLAEVRTGIVVAGTVGHSSARTVAGFRDHGVEIAPVTPKELPLGDLTMGPLPDLGLTGPVFTGSQAVRQRSAR
jgi:hypothetical protein